MVLGIDASQANRKIRSGTEWYAFYLLQEFKKLLGGRQDIEVRLYTRDGLQSDLAQGLPRNFKVKILRWPLKYFWGQIRLSIEMLANPPDVLFCPAHTIPLIHPKPSPRPDPDPGAPSPEQGEGKKAGGTFTTLHDVGFEDYPELYDRLSLWYHKWAARMAVRTAAHIFTVSEFSKGRIVENYGLDPNKITVTLLGQHQTLTIVKSWWDKLKKYNLNENNYLLYVGRLEPKKNILNLVKGYEMSGVKLPLVLAGRKIGINDLEEYLESRSELKKRVLFLGVFDETDKSALYAGAKIFLFPTLYEGFGLPILEAQSAGTPVITSNTASNPEIAGQGAVFINPDSTYEIADAIKKLTHDESLLKEKIRLGYENIKRFSWEETARKTLDRLV